MEHAVDIDIEEGLMYNYQRANTGGMVTVQNLIGPLIQNRFL